MEVGPLGKLLGGIAKPPHRRSAFTHYQDRYFATRVSPEYQRRWAAELEAYSEYTPEQRVEKGIEKPWSVRTMTITTAEIWKQESEQFRAQVREEANAVHQKSLERYELGLRAVKTPLDYHK